MNFLPGRDIFLQRSELNRPINILLAVLTVAATITITIIFFLIFDGLFTGSTVVSQGLVMMVGQLVIGQMIHQRDWMKAHWKDRAFSVAFRCLAIPALTIIATGLGHIPWIEGNRLIPQNVALIPYIYLLVSGILLWWRSVRTLGIDNLSLLYVYYPSESRLVNSNVYNVLRHPVYSAALRIAWALVIWNGSPFALFVGLASPLAMFLWLRWAEEKELIERFGDGYRQYRKHTPAFFNFNPNTWLTLWKFILGISR